MNQKNIIMKAFFLIFVIGALCSGAFAQKFDLDYYKTYPELGTYAFGKSIMLTGDDSIVIAGEAANNHVFIMKTDKNGDKLWDTFESTDYVNYQTINDMILDKDGNYVMVGYYNASSYTYFNKVSPQGKFLATTIDGAQFGYGLGYGVAQTLDEGFFIASVYRDYNLGDLVSIRKVNNQGDFEWSKSFFGGQTRALKKKSNTEYYMTGYRDYFKGSDIDGDVFLMKLDINGDSVWTKIFVKEGTDEFGNDLMILPDNAGFLICGTEPDSANANNTQGFLLKTDINGNMEWKTSYTRALPSYGPTSFLKMEMDPHGDVVVMAMTNGGSSDLTLLKYNLNGDRLQVEHFDFKLNEKYGDIVINSIGEIFVTGSAPNGSLLKIIDHCPLDPVNAYLLDPEPNLGDDVYVAMDNSMSGFEYKLFNLNTKEVVDSADGTGTALYLNGGPLIHPAESDTQMYIVRLKHPIYNCSKHSDTLFVVLPPTSIRSSRLLSVRVFPNPSKDQFTISYQLYQNEKISLSICDLQGRLVQTISHMTNKEVGRHSEIYTVPENLASGTYLLKFKSEHEIKSLRLLVK